MIMRVDYVNVIPFSSRDVERDNRTRVCSYSVAAAALTPLTMYPQTQVELVREDEQSLRCNESASKLKGKKNFVLCLGI